MKYALDTNGKKIFPSYSGESAICGFCNEKVIGKCGTVYIWHWQHVRNANCDFWKEGETEWHRDWKNKFPVEWQETIIIKNDEKHIADIFTSDGIVIEFQNSAISSSTIAVREKFYGNMIWVINALTFKNNLITENKSDKLLAESERLYLIKRSLIQRHNYHNLHNLKKKQITLAFEIQATEDELKMLLSLTDIFSSYNKNADTFAEQILNIWQSDNLSVDPFLLEITNDDALVSKKTFFRLLGELKRNKYYLDLADKNSREHDEFYSERKELLMQVELLKPVLKEELKFVALQYLNLENQIDHLKSVISFLKYENAEGDEEYKKLKISIDDYIKTNLEKLEAEFIEEQNRIARDLDKVTLSWKHERKSWASATAPIFFDIGDGKLLFKYPDNKAIIENVSDFISKYNPN